MYKSASWIGVFGSSVAVTLGFAGSANAGLLADNDAAALPGFTGSQNFSASVAPGFSVDADVDYAVFAPGTFPFADPSGGSDYVYAYQIANLDTNIGKFTVGLDGDETLGAVSFITDQGVVDPTVSEYIGAGPTSAAWTFAPNTFTNGLSSAVLFFTSAQAPEFDNATVAAVFSNTQQLPSPLPEPATLALIAMGLGLTAVRRRRA